MEDVPIFRASKKRRFTRQKDVTSEDDNELEVQGQEGSSPAPGDEDLSQDVSVANLLKLRKQSKPRGGVQFSNRRSARDEADDSSFKALVKADPSEETLKNISSRFVGSTGQVVDVDKHMMAYIDSEIAKSRAADALQASSSNIYDAAEDEDYTSESDDECPSSNVHQVMSSKTTVPTYATRNPLSEFDLGPQAHSTNLERTTLAIARAKSGLPISSTDPQPAPRPRRRPRKPRLGPDGKPYRPRPRKRRNSTDIARDALVEQVLHENRPEGVYANTTTGTNPGSSTNANPTPNNQPSTTTPNNNNAANGDNELDEPADERFAAQFKQQFMDAMAERRQQRHKQTPSSQAATAAAKAAKAAKAQEGGFVHGPKLGGSRSARAKMVAALQQKQMEQKQQSSSSSQPPPT